MKKLGVLFAVIATIMMLMVSCGEKKPEVKKTERVIEIKGWGFAKHGEKMKSEIKAKGAAKAMLMEMTGGQTFVYSAPEKSLKFKLGRQREFLGRKPYTLETYKAGKMLQSFAVQTARIKIMLPEKQAVYKRSAKMNGNDFDGTLRKLAKKAVKDLFNELKKDGSVPMKGTIWISDIQLTRGKKDITLKCAFSMVVE